MTYIQYLNQFHRWRENGNPGDKVIVLYLNMLDMFNQRYWPEWAGVTTQQLMVLANTANKNAALGARDALVKAGFLEYRKGRKGKATMYRLLPFGIESDTESDTENVTENHGANRIGDGAETRNGGGFGSENGGAAGNGATSGNTDVTAPKNGIKSDTENVTKNVTETDTKNVTENRTPNKTKTQTKTKNGRERGGADAAASPAVRHKYGKYKHVLLSDEEVRELGEKLGQEETNRCVRYLDEYMEIHGNKCHWKNFYLVALKCSREKWGIRPGDNSADRNGGTDWEALAREMDEEDARRDML